LPCYIFLTVLAGFLVLDLETILHPTIFAVFDMVSDIFDFIRILFLIFCKNVNLFNMFL